MTQKLYFEDAFQTAFDAKAVKIETREGAAWLALERTLFYPEGGGQPYDTGTLCYAGQAAAVLDVQVDETGVIWHKIALAEGSRLPEAGEVVEGEIDWPRRFDHMQQHTGEHIIANCVYRLTGGFTHGLHIGQEVCTIDISLPDQKTRLDDKTLGEIETLANQKIAEDGMIRCYFPKKDALRALPLRKDPTVEDNIRVCDIGGFEMVACGGTHLSRASQVGLVKILYAQPARGKLRLFFLCGLRAVRHYALCYTAASQAASQLSVKEEELPHRLAEVLKQAADTRRELGALLRKESLAKVPALLADALVLADGRRVVMAELAEKDQPAMEAVAKELVAESRVIALLCVPAQGRYNLLFARSDDVDINLNDFIKSTGAKGGGRPEFVRGAADDSLPWEAAKVMAPHF